MSGKNFRFTFLLAILAMLLVALEAYSGPLASPLSISTNNLRSITQKKRKVNLRKPQYCTINYEDTRNYIRHDPNLTAIYFVTPTYPRPEQIPELTRLSHTLMLVPRIHWILAEDNFRCSKHVQSILTNSGLPYTYILSPKPDYRKGKPLPPGVISRGVANRRAALDWIRRNVHNGVLYFGDDDNTYDLELFKEIRNTKKLSMLPVGLVGGFGVSSPVVANGTVVGFFDSWYSNRKFPVDMAGFAVNIQHLRRTSNMPYTAGMLEDGFLTSSGFNIEDIEPLAENCTKVYVWHTQTIKNKKKKLRANVNHMKNSKYENLGILLDDLSKINVIKINHIYGANSYVIYNYSKTFFWDRYN